MSPDHRYFWSTRFVVARLQRDELSEAAVFRYFLAVMAFDGLQLALVAVTPAAQMSAARSAGAWLTFALTLAGLTAVYACNGGARGRGFLHRYFPLSMTVGWKFAAVLLALNAALGAVPQALAGPQALAWVSVAATALLNVMMFGCIGRSMTAVVAQGEPAIAGTKPHNACYGTHPEAES